MTLYIVTVAEDRLWRQNSSSCTK